MLQYTRLNFSLVLRSISKVFDRGGSVEGVGVINIDQDEFNLYPYVHCECDGRPTSSLILCHRRQQSRPVEQLEARGIPNNKTDGFLAHCITYQDLEGMIIARRRQGCQSDLDLA